MAARASERAQVKETNRPPPREPLKGRVGNGNNGRGAAGGKERERETRDNDLTFRMRTDAVGRGSEGTIKSQD